MSTEFKYTKELRFWCQKVLPLVYDDSLSYYELLCKVVGKINILIENNNNLPDIIVEEIQKYITPESIREILEEIFDDLRANIASADDHESTTATADREEGELLWWKDELYEVVRHIDIGDAYIVGGTNPNIVRVTVEELIAREIQNRIDGDDTLDDKIDDEISARENADTLLDGKIDDEITARENADGVLDGKIDDEITARENADGVLDDKIDDEITARENADTEITGDIGDLDDLQTVNKSNLVEAINEALTTAGKIVYNPSDNLGLDSTGTNDCSSILSSLDTNVGFKNGRYKIATDCVIDCDLVFANDAQLVIEPNVSVTINGCIIASRRKIFSGDITNLTINNQTNEEGYPEWFGAKADGLTDSTTAIQASVDRFVKTTLVAGVYRISGSINLHDDSVLCGIKDTLHYTGENPNFKGTVIQPFLPFTDNIAINIDDCVGATVRDLIINFDESVVEGGIGISVSNSIRVRLNDIFIRNPQTGIYYTENIACYIEHILSYQKSNTAGLLVTGIHLLGASKGMSSTYISKCGCGFGGTADEIGLYAHGILNDLYVDHFEVALGKVGIQLNPNGPNIVTQGDIFLNNIVLDGQSNCCLRLQGTNQIVNEANIQINNLWCGFVETSLNLYAVELITIRNVHIDGAEIYSNARGVLFNSAARCMLTNSNIVNATDGIVANSMGVVVSNTGLAKVLNCIILNFDVAILTDASPTLCEFGVNGVTLRGILLNNGTVAYTMSLDDIVNTTYNCIIRGPFKITA